MTKQEELDVVDTLLQQAAATGIAEWQEGAHRTKYYNLADLLKWKSRVENELYQESHRITVPIREVNQ